MSALSRPVRDLLFKFTDPGTGTQRTVHWLGVYNPETFTVEDARTKVYALKTRVGTANVAETLRQQKGAAGEARQDRR